MEVVGIIYIIFRWLGQRSGLAEFGTLQLEFRELSRVTKNPIYEKAAMKIYDIVRKTNSPNGLYPAFISFNF